MLYMCKCLILLLLKLCHVGKEESKSRSSTGYTVQACVQWGAVGGLRCSVLWQAQNKWCSVGWVCSEVTVAAYKEETTGKKMAVRYTSSTSHNEFPYRKMKSLHCAEERKNSFVQH